MERETGKMKVNGKAFPIGVLILFFGRKITKWVRAFGMGE